MKILHVINGLGAGGAQNLLIPLTKKAVEDGHSVAILQLIKVFDQTVTKKIEEVGGHVKWIEEKGSLYNPLLVIKLFPWLLKYDIINVHLFPSFYWAGFARIFIRRRVSMVYTEHSTTNRRRKNRLFKIVDKFLYNYSYNQIIACSSRVKDNLNIVFPSIKNVCVINNGVDVFLYENATAYKRENYLKIPSDSFIVTMVARFAYPKRQDIVIKALSLLPLSFHVVFVGSTAQTKGLLDVKIQADDLGLSERAHFLYNRADVPQLLKSSDAVVISSEYEGLSLSSIEAMASGKPVIASDVEGLREVVGGAGILYPLEDYGKLAKVLMELSEDKCLRERVSKSCMDKARKYDATIMANCYLRVYQETIAKCVQ